MHTLVASCCHATLYNSILNWWKWHTHVLSITICMILINHHYYSMGFGLGHYGPLTRYVTLRVAHAPGMPGTFSPTADVKGNRKLAIPACITARASHTCHDACRDCLPALAGKTFPAFPAHAHPQFYLSRKRPIEEGHFHPHASSEIRTWIINYIHGKPSTLQMLQTWKYWIEYDKSV